MMPGDSLRAFKQAITMHDNIMRSVENILAKVPMVQELLDEMTEVRPSTASNLPQCSRCDDKSITLLVMSVVEPYIKPFISQVVSRKTLALYNCLGC